MSEAIATTVGQTPASQAEHEQMLSKLGSGIKLTPAQIAILATPATYDDVDVLPSGELYVPGHRWRERLNAALGTMAWSVRPGPCLMDEHQGDLESKSVLYRTVTLVTSRCSKCRQTISVCDCKVGSKMEIVPLSTAIGAQEYHASNKRMTYDDAAEAAVTNGLMRCGKLFGLFENLWDKQWAQAAQDDLCVRVQVQDAWGGSSKTRWQWRRKDRKPFPREVGGDHRSQNRQERPQAPRQAPPPQQGRTEAVAAQKSLPAASSDLQPLQAPQGPEYIKAMRVVTPKGGGGKYWVYDTTHRTFATSDQGTMLALENARSRQQELVDVVVEPIPLDGGGTRNRLVEFKRKGGK